MNSGSMVSNSNTVVLFKTSTSLIQPEFKYVFTQNPKSTWVLEMQHQYEDEDPFYNPQLSVNPYQNATSQTQMILVQFC
jgi:hypothetical protein